MKPQGALDSSFRGNEYLSIYPHIIYSSGMDRPACRAGYYVEIPGKTAWIELSAWLRR